jgi:hypothetical protein
MLASVVTPQEAASAWRIAGRVGRKSWIEPAPFNAEDWDLFASDEPTQIKWTREQVATWVKFAGTNLNGTPHNTPRAINGALENRGSTFVMFLEPVAKGTPSSLEATLKISPFDLPCNGFQPMCPGVYTSHHDTPYPKVKLTSGYSTEDCKKFIGDIMEAHLDLVPGTLKCEAVSFDGGSTSIPLSYTILWPEQNIRIRVTCNDVLTEIEEKKTGSPPVFTMYSCWNIKVFN